MDWDVHLEVTAKSIRVFAIELTIIMCSRQHDGLLMNLKLQYLSGKESSFRMVLFGRKMLNSQGNRYDRVSELQAGRVSCTIGTGCS